jgi:hypothetical protein
MQGALLLVFLIIIFGVLAYMCSQIDGFADLHSDFKTDRLKQYSNIGISTLTADTVGSLGNSANKYTATTPITNINNTPLFSAPSGLFAISKTCEAIQTMDCSAFDKPGFSLNCGICLDIGKNSKGEPIAGGGLVLLDDDKTTARQSKISGFMTSYIPTVGFCPAGKLVSTKEECIKLKRQLQCEKNESFDLPGCAQCYADGSFSIVDTVANPGVITGSGEIMVVGNGVLNISEQGFPSVTNIRLSQNTPYVYAIKGTEGTIIILTVNTAITDTTAPASASALIDSSSLYIAGYISGETLKGEFDNDLIDITLTDRTTGRKPSVAGSISINDTLVAKMIPAFGQNGMVLVVTVPFSFASTTSEEAYLCQTGPYVTKSSSAKILESNPCHAKGSRPGNYNLECLQNIWISNGCTQSGKYYPSNDSTAALLMANPNGSFRSTNDIANFVYNQALITSTGVDANGKKQSTARWSDVSVSCTGAPTAIASPCDNVKNGGIPSPECIAYLWKNQGESKPTGATYTGYGSSLSEGFINAEYCKTDGTLSPVDSNGNIKPEVIAWWQTKGDINKVKSIMSNIYGSANAQNNPDDIRLEYIQQCYGPVALASQPIKAPPQMDKCPSPTTSFIKRVFHTRRDNIVASNFSTYPDFVFSMNITPLGVVNEWSSLIHMTTGKDQFEFGARALAIFFYPGTITKLAVHIDHTTEPGWCARVNDRDGLEVPFAIGKKSLFVVSCVGPNITIMLDGTVYGKFTHNGMRVTDEVTVYASSPWYVSAKCLITSACYGEVENTSAPGLIRAKSVSLVGGQGGIASSVDGTIWKRSTNPIFNNTLIYFIVYNGSYWLAGGQSPSGASLGISRNGITWERVESMNNYGGQNSSFDSALWAGNRWFIMCTNVSKNYVTEIFYSNDGTRWVPLRIGKASNQSQLAASSSVIIASGINVNMQGSAIYYSQDRGKTWMVSKSADSFFGGAGGLYCAGYNGTYFLAGGCENAWGGPPILIYSLDGITWNKASLPVSSNRIWAVCSNGSMWVASTQETLIYSTDTINWYKSSYSTYGISNTRGHLSWNGSAWFAGTTTGAITSTDGINWTVSPASKLFPSGVYASG